MSRALDALRFEIDELNHRILELLSERGRCALAIAAHKRAADLPIRDPRREAELLEGLASRNPGPFDDGEVRAVFREIIEASVRLMGDETRAPKRLMGGEKCDSALRVISTRL